MPHQIKVGTNYIISLKCIIKSSNSKIKSDLSQRSNEKKTGGK